MHNIIIYHYSCNKIDIYIEFLYILKTFMLNKCFAVISLILKLKPAGIYAQSLTEIQDLIKPNSTENCETKLSGFIYFSKTFAGFS